MKPARSLRPVLAALLLFSAAAFADAPPAPDYAQPAAWAAWPGRPSHADDRPSGVAPGGAQEADVFFIHPTTDLSLRSGNAAYDEAGEVSARVNETVLRMQASVFNACCRVYAPHYRQATLHAITHDAPADLAADELAYGDVARAFDAFLAASGGRPFILASHSQGSIHGLRLLQERILGTPLQGRLVAAYLVGLALPAEIAQLGLPVCDSPSATGCVLTWNSVRRGHVDTRRKDDALVWWRGHYEAVAGRPLVCVNPLDWKRDSAAPPSANLGAIYRPGRGEPLPAPVAELTGAWCEDGLLGVEIPLGQRRHFGDILTLTGVYHDFDVGLFYMNLRENAQRRVRAWRAAHVARTD